MILRFRLGLSLVCFCLPEPIRHLKCPGDPYHFADGNQQRAELAMAWEVFIISAAEAGVWCRDDLKLSHALGDLQLDDGVTFTQSREDDLLLHGKTQISPPLTLNRRTEPSSVH